MKTIPHPDFKSAERLKPLDLNKIHFGGMHSSLADKPTRPD